MLYYELSMVNLSVPLLVDNLNCFHFLTIQKQALRGETGASSYVAAAIY